MCWRASCKNVSREQRLRRLAGLARDGIPSLTGANRAEARYWESSLHELDVADPEFIPGAGGEERPEVRGT